MGTISFGPSIYFQQIADAGSQYEKTRDHDEEADGEKLGLLEATVATPSDENRYCDSVPNYDAGTIWGLLEQPLDMRKPEMVNDIADIISKLEVFYNLPWQARLQLCRCATALKIAAGKELPMERVVFKPTADVVIVLHGGAVLEGSSSQVLAEGASPQLPEVETNHDELRTLRHLAPGDSVSFTDVSTWGCYPTEGRDVGIKAVRCRAEVDTHFMVISAELNKSVLNPCLVRNESRVLGLLRKCHLFSEWTRDQIAQLCQFVWMELHHPQVELLKAWEAAPVVYIVESGHCSIGSSLLGIESKAMNAKRSEREESHFRHGIEIQQLGHGDCFGETSLVGNQRLWAHLRTTTDCKVGCLPGKAVGLHKFPIHNVFCQYVSIPIIHFIGVFCRKTH